MPRVPKIPAYRLHKPSGQAVVTIRTVAGDRRDVYLGVFNSPESRTEYGRLIAELASTPVFATSKTPSDRPTIDQILLAFLAHAEKHYRDPDGKPTDEVREIKRSSFHLHKLYGHTIAAEFGPRALATVRQEMITADWCRTLINRRVERIKRAFKWAASQELVPVTVYDALRTLAGLQKGRTDARESAPVKPVELPHVGATLPFLTTHVRAMVELELLTGMRPGEACALTLEEIDRTREPWAYRPDRHKTAHRGRPRVILFGPKARAILTAFIHERGTKPDAPVFSPIAAREEWAQALRSKRKSKVPPSQVDRRKANPKRRPGTRYTVAAYGSAIRKAAVKAGVPNWHPNQLRHTFASLVRKTHGLEAAQVLLGHSHANVTQVYAERDEALAARVAAEIG